jgi:hypothetical protein
MKTKIEYGNSWRDFCILFADYLLIWFWDEQCFIYLLNIFVCLIKLLYIKTAIHKKNDRYLVKCRWMIVYFFYNIIETVNKNQLINFFEHALPIIFKQKF